MLVHREKANPAVNERFSRRSARIGRECGSFGAQGADSTTRGVFRPESPPFTATGRK
jgi:hypothetical protein